MGWLCRRLLRSRLVLVGTLTALFVLVHVAVPDPKTIFLDPEAPPEAAAVRVEQLGLDRPLWVQYGRWVRRAIVLDLGASFHHGIPVWDRIAASLPYTLLLGAVALALALGAAVGLALYCARWPRGAASRAVFAAATVLHAVPSFWLGLMLLALTPRLLPAHPLGGAWSPALQLAEPGSVPFGMCLWDLAQHLLLPALTLGCAQWGGLLLVARASLLEVLQQDFIRAAHAKGLTPGRVLVAHGLRNALLPLCAVVGLHVPALVSGAVVVESVFAWPGMGSLLLDAIQQRDFPVVLGVGLLATVAVLAGSLLADLLVRLLDPRVTHA
jgi:peptide/nickel transport system permease protein